METQNKGDDVLIDGASYTGESGGPQKVLGLFDAVALIVGIVVGAGIFSFPSLVASSTASETAFVSLWVAGGLISLIGALCYAELSTTFPSAGGDYHFLQRAFGGRLAFLFAWARMSVIQTGSIAILAYVFGDYATQLFDLGQYSPILYAGLIITVLTIINIIGIQFGAGTQKLLTSLQVIGVAAIIVAGLLFAPEGSASLVKAAPLPEMTSYGLAMVFVLLTFGGWNEAAYISAEMRGGRRQIAKALIIGIAIITTIYVLINIAYLNVLGLGGLAGSSAVAGDVMRITVGDGAAWLIGLMVAIAALTSANATIFTGARTNYALGRDYTAFRSLGVWHDRADSPVNAFVVQGLIALGLVGLGLWTREGMKSIVDYTAPVFWFFLLMVGISLFVLRRKYPDAERPFRVPLYPVAPLVFCITSAYLMYSSLMYTGLGSLVGVGVLAVGAVVMLILGNSDNFETKDENRRENDEINAL